MATFWATFCLSKFITFLPEKAVSEHSLLYVGFDVDVLGFQIELCYKYFGPFLT